MTQLGKQLTIFICLIAAIGSGIAFAADAGVILNPESPTSVVNNQPVPFDLATAIGYLVTIVMCLASVYTGLTSYKRPAGILGWLRAAADLLSFVTHRDSPGTLQMPLLQHSQPPNGVYKTPPVSVVIFVLPLLGCTPINNLVCGPGMHLVPPDPQACTVAFLEAATTIAINVPACATTPVSALCIDAVIAAGKELAPCLPTCATNAVEAARRGGGVKVKVAPNVLRQHVIDSLRATGHQKVGK